MRRGRSRRRRSRGPLLSWGGRRGSYVWRCTGQGRQADVAGRRGGYRQGMRTAGWASSLQRWARARPLLIDTVLAIGFAVAGLLTTDRGESAAPAGPYEQRDALSLALVLAATLPYAARRRAPALVYVVTAMAVTVLMLSGYDEGALPSVLVVGAYTVAAQRPVREVVSATAVVAVLLVILLLSDAPHRSASPPARTEAPEWASSPEIAP